MEIRILCPKTRNCKRSTVQADHPKTKFSRRSTQVGRMETRDGDLLQIDFAGSFSQDKLGDGKLVKVEFGVLNCST